MINDAAAGLKRRRSAAAAAMGNTPLSYHSTPFILIFLFHLNTFRFFLVAIDLKVLIIFLVCFNSSHFLFFLGLQGHDDTRTKKKKNCVVFFFFNLFKFSSEYFKKSYDLEGLSSVFVSFRQR